MNRSTRVLTHLALAPLALGAGLLSSCKLFVGGAIPTDANRVECSLLVRSIPEPDADPGTQIAEATVTSRDSGFRAFYYTTNQCTPDLTHPSSEAIESDWLRRVGDGISVQRTEPNSIFSLANEWCHVAATLSCIETDEEVGTCRQVTSSEGEPIPACPDPPDLPDGSLELVCGDEPCSLLVDRGRILLDFGSLDLDQTQERFVDVLNVGSEPVEVIVDGTIVPITAQADFEVPLDSNTCHPSLGNGDFLTLAPDSKCRFAIVFAPQSEGEHRAEVNVTSSVAPNLRTIELVGTYFTSGRPSDS